MKLRLKEALEATVARDSEDEEMTMGVLVAGLAGRGLKTGGSGVVRSSTTPFLGKSGRLTGLGDGLPDDIEI